MLRGARLIFSTPWGLHADKSAAISLAHRLPDHLAHCEDGHVEPSVDFDYAAVERALRSIERHKIPSADRDHVRSEVDRSLRETISNLSSDQTDVLLAMLVRVLDWLWSDGMKNPDGLQIRAMLLCWNFLEHLRPLTLTQLARGFGKRKQSLGRWQDQFKLDFPEIKTCHMKFGDPVLDGEEEEGEK